MKVLKLFSVLALSAMTLMAVAAPTRGFKMTISDNQTTDQGIDELALYEKADYTDITTNSSSELGVKEQDYNILFYAVVNSAKYSTVWFNDIDGIKLTFESNSRTSYKITFSNVFGSVKLYDAVEDSVINVVAAGTYEFTCAANSTIADRFQVGEPAYTREVTAGDWGTLCLPWASTALDGATYYETLGTKNDQGIALAEVSALEAGKPYVFQATAAEIKVTYNPSTKVTAEKAGEKCTGSFAGCTVPAGQYLIVDNLLYKAEGTGNSIDANRAYFDVASMTAYTPAPGRRVVFFGGKTTPTALEAAEAPAMKDGKMMIDGQLIIIKGGKMFNAQGAAL